MEKRKLSTLLIVPVAMLLVLPFATQAAGNTYYMAVECNSFSSPGHQFAFGDLVFLGHYVYTVCPANGGFHETFTSFASTATGLYVFKGLAGTSYKTVYGSFGPNSCSVEYEVNGPGEGSYAYFFIATSACYDT